MSDDPETTYTEGSRAAWRQMLALCLRNLGDDAPQAARLTLQLEQARATLRTVCREHGDNDWPDELHLADVIDKHLARHLGPGPAAVKLQRMTTKRNRWRAFAQEVTEALGVEWRAMDGTTMMAQVREQIAALRERVRALEEDAHERDQLARERDR